jgi:molybdenum cofactor cytidylyltransferase
MVVGAVILAAGASRRMGGRPKALLMVGGTSFLALLTGTFRSAGVDQVLAVVSSELRPRAAALAVPGLELVVPPAPTAEPLASLKAGMAVIPDDWQAMLVQPVDHPLVHPHTVRRQIDLFSADAERPVVQLRRRGCGGHPLLVGRTCFQEILDLPEGGDGLRDLLRADPGRIIPCETADRGAFSGVNTEEDFRRLLSQETGGRPISHPSR